MHGGAGCEAPPRVADSQSLRLALVWEQEGRGRLKTPGDILSIFLLPPRESWGTYGEMSLEGRGQDSTLAGSLAVLAAAVREGALG